MMIVSADCNALSPPRSVARRDAAERLAAPRRHNIAALTYLFIINIIGDTGLFTLYIFSRHSPFIKI